MRTPPVESPAETSRPHPLLESGAIPRAAAVERCWAHLRSRSALLRLAPLLPRRGRDDLAAILAWFAALEEADELAAAAGRRRALAALRAELERAVASRPETPLGVALDATLRVLGLPPALLREPLDALEAVGGRAAFETRAALLAHARRVARPAGRALLACLGARNDRNEVLADSLSTGVALARWLARIREHWERGRLYLPVEELLQRGVTLAALDAPQPSEPLRAAVAAQVDATRELLARGWPLCAALGPAHGRWLAFTLRWHAASLSALEARRFDVLRGTPPAGAARFLACACAALWTTDAPALRA